MFLVLAVPWWGYQTIIGYYCLLAVCLRIAWAWRGRSCMGEGPETVSREAHYEVWVSIAPGPDLAAMLFRERWTVRRWPWAVQVLGLLRNATFPCPRFQNTPNFCQVQDVCLGRWLAATQPPPTKKNTLHTNFHPLTILPTVGVHWHPWTVICHSIYNKQSLRKSLHKP